MPTCNICQHNIFIDFNGRSKVMCQKCHSLERHRLAAEIYRNFGLFDQSNSLRYVLHLAPERMLASMLLKNQSLNYVASDPRTESYNWTRILRLYLPDDFKVFHDGYFDFIIHNHVLEHIPGSYKDHLLEFKRLLRKGGAMIFTIPGPSRSRLTEEGGEFFSSDSERLAKFGQEDHFKLFGYDLIDTLKETPDMSFYFDNISDAERNALSIPNGSNKFLIWEKTE